MNSFNNTITWQRASTAFPNSPIIGSSLIFNEIKQGMVGDCYFLAALAAIGNIPGRLQSVILTPNIASGIFAVQVYLKGIPTVVYIDDLLPF